VAFCTEDFGNWADCQGYLKIDGRLLESMEGFTMFIQKVKGGAYDIDDLRYK
jgi:hypothetical protein